MKTNQSPAATESPQLRKLTRKPALLAAAALIGAGVLGLSLNPSVPFAVAETTETAQTVETPFGSAPLSFADLVAKVSPAVVSINVKGDVKVADNNGSPIPGMPNIPEDSPLYDFFKQFRKGMPSPKHSPSLAQGSGFFITDDGYVVTNNHVVEDAEDITVTMEDGEKFSAKRIGTDPRTDLALLKVTDKTNKKFPFVEMSDETPRVGDWVLAVGNPFGLGGTVTAGIISAHNRDIGSGSPYDYLQIDAAVNRGNSGGPSFGLDGKVVGVNTAIFSPSGGNVGIAFAVPAALVTEVIADLKDDGSVDRGWLGVVIQSVNDDIADSVGLAKAKGAMITKVTEDGPASKEDIKAGDVIVEVNGNEVKDSRDLARKIAGLNPDTEVKLSIVRYGDKREVAMQLGTFPSNTKMAALEKEKPEDLSEQMKDLGLSLAPASKIPGIGEKGVLITEVDPESDAADKGLEAGNIILQVAGVDVSNPDDVAEGIKKAMESAKGDKDTVKVLMQVKKGDQTSFVALSLKKA